MSRGIRLYRRLDRWLLDRSPLQYGLLVAVFWMVIWSVGVSVGFWSAPVNSTAIALLGAVIVGGFSVVGRVVMARSS